MGAAAANLVKAFDDGHAFAVLDRLHGGPFSARPGADDDHVEVHFPGGLHSALLLTSAG
jgi:hypothetical protein